MGMFETSRHQSSVAYSQRGLRAKSDPAAISDINSNGDPPQKELSSKSFKRAVGRSWRYKGLSRRRTVEFKAFRRTPATLSEIKPT
jgi:hypothetical protein